MKYLKKIFESIYPIDGYEIIEFDEYIKRSNLNSEEFNKLLSIIRGSFEYKSNFIITQHNGLSVHITHKLCWVFDDMLPEIRYLFLNEKNVESSYDYLSIQLVLGTLGDDYYTLMVSDPSNNNSLCLKIDQIDIMEKVIYIIINCIKNIDNDVNDPINIAYKKCNEIVDRIEEIKYDIINMDFPVIDSNNIFNTIQKKINK